MTDPNQLVVLECDWMTQDDCWLRSAPMVDPEWADHQGVLTWNHLESGDWVCPVCYIAYLNVKIGWGIE